MDAETRYERLVAAPPSAKLVYKVLELDAPLTHGEITDAAVLPSRTVSYALSRLREVNVIEATPNPNDPRKRDYRPLPIEETDADRDADRDADPTERETASTDSGSTIAIQGSD